MKPKIIAIITTVLMAVSSLAGAGLACAGCLEGPCCCRGPAMTGQAADAPMIRPARGCCCQAAGDSPCTLTVSPAAFDVAPAVPPGRIHVHPPAVSAAVIPGDAPVDAAITFFPDLEDPLFQKSFPPTYLSVMSFLC